MMEDREGLVKMTKVFIDFTRSLDFLSKLEMWKALKRFFHESPARLICIFGQESSQM